MSVNAWKSVNTWGAARRINDIDADNDVYVGQTGVTISADLIDNPSTTQIVTLGGEALTITDWNAGQPIVTIPASIELQWGITHELVVTDDTGAVTFLTPVTLSPPPGWAAVAWNGIIPEAGSESFYSNAQTDVAVGSYTMQSGDAVMYQTAAGLTVDAYTVPTISPYGSATGNYKIWREATTDYTAESTYAFNDAGFVTLNLNATAPNLALSGSSAQLVTDAELLLEASAPNLSFSGSTAQLKTGQLLELEAISPGLILSGSTAQLEAGQTLLLEATAPALVLSGSSASFGSTVLTQADIDNIVNALFSRIIENGETFEQQLRLIRAEAAGHLTVSGNQVGIRDAANTKDRITATTDSNGQRIVVTTDPD